MERTPRRTHPSTSHSSYNNSYPNNVTQSPSRHQNQQQTQLFTENLGGLPMVIDASSWKKGKPAQEQCDIRGPQARQLGADRERLKDMMADSFSRNETISILPGFKDTRSIAKPCIKLAASSNSFSHRNAIKADKAVAGYCPQQGWKLQEFQNQQRQAQQQYYQQPPSTQNRQQHLQNGKVHEVRSDRGAGGDNDQTPWPYSKCQKSQRAIREAQAAYKRDLDRQIEEKRMNQKGNSRSAAAAPATKTTKDSETPRPINQSVSLEAFRNTGFLPPWFDPIRNNPLYTNAHPAHQDPKQDHNPTMMCEEDGQHAEGSSEQNQQTMTSSQAEVLPKTNNNNSCPIDYQPSQIMYAPNPPNIANLDGNYYIVSQDILNQLNQGSLQIQNLSLFPTPTYNQNPSVQQNVAPNQSHSRQQIIGASSSENVQLSGASMKQQHSYQSQPQPTDQQTQNSNNNQQASSIQSIHISQIQQHQQPNGNPQLHQQQSMQQNIWTPWLAPNNNFSLNLRNLPPPPTPPLQGESTQTNQSSPRGENSQAGFHNNQDGGRQDSLSSDSVPAPPHHSDEPKNSQQPESATLSPSHPEEPHETNPDSTGESLLKIDSPNDNPEQFFERERSGEEPRPNPLPHVSQTSSQRPNEEDMRLRYKSELAKQIEEKKRLEHEKAAKQEEEEARMQKKVEEDQKRMVEEYEKEQNLEKIKQEEYKKRQEMIVKEIERLDRAAEAEKERKKLERRKSQAALLMQRKSEESLEETTKPPQVYESPIDLTVCAASKWKHLERVKSPVKSESSDEHISDCHSPRPRTVVISQHRPAIHDTPRSNAPLSEPLPSSSTNSFDNDKMQNDISFLATVRQALRDEDTRIGNIIKKKERFFVTI